MRTRLSFLALVLLWPVGHAEVTLPSLFSDHMVVQRSQPLMVWGWADPGERVEVQVAGRKANTQADDSGHWKVRLAPLKAGGPYEMVVRGRANTLTLSDVLVGEVWICSGQSNMDLPLRVVRNGNAEVAAAHHPRLRLLTVPRRTADETLEDFQGGWSACTPESATTFTAVGYCFGRTLLEQLDVPIGLIHTSWGGTPAEAWTRAETLASHSNLQPILETWRGRIREHAAAMQKYEKDLAAWKAVGSPRREEPRRPVLWMQNAPGRLYNGMIAPLVPVAFRGAIWYQGESNAGRAYQYRELFPTMIGDWRKAWGGRDFPFLFVQLANYMAKQPQPGDSNWAELREAQLRTLKLRNTGMASAIDIGEASDIHPRNKQEVGRRLALWALATAYHRPFEDSGPLYKGMRRHGQSILLRFTHTEGGLALWEGGLAFAVAGADRRFAWAEARVEGDRVRVWSNDVARPVAVRYGWADNPESVLYNGAGLPASPFRTDDWPGRTAGKLAP